ncbi:MAG: WGR domain-containing protein, partial [Candidatus Eremiobacterota bacterium]
MRRFEFQEGSSNKFWEIHHEGDSFTVRWGKLGTQGQTQT